MRKKSNNSRAQDNNTSANTTRARKLKILVKNAAGKDKTPENDDTDSTIIKNENEISINKTESQSNNDNTSPNKNHNDDEDDVSDE